MALTLLLATGLCGCVYYGAYNPQAITSLSECNLLVAPPTLPESLVSRLSEGRIILGYISVATVGGWEPWAVNVTREIIVGRLGAWNETVVNPCSQKWWKIFRGAVDWILSRGYNGVFIDNLDLVDEYPWMKACIINLVRSVKREHPHAVVMVNRGFSILPRIADSIDYLLVESYPSYYDFGAHEYRFWKGRDLEWIVSRIREAERLAETHGFRIILLAYGDPADQGMIEEVCRVVEEYTPGLPVYIAPWDLMKPGRCVQCGSPIETATWTNTTTASVGLGEETRVTRARPTTIPVWEAVGAAVLGATAAFILYVFALRRGRR